MAVAQQEVEQAKVLAQEGKAKAAVALLSQLIQRDASNVGAWLALSDVVDDPERAEYCLQKVLTLDPGNATALEKLSSSKGGSLSVGALGGLNQVERPIQDDPTPAQSSHDSDSGQMKRPEPESSIPQATADPPEQPEEVPVPEELAEAPIEETAEPDRFQDSEAQLEAAPPAPEIPTEAFDGDAVEHDGALANEAQFAPAAAASEEVPQEPVKRSSVSRTDLILIGLTVLVGIVLCALVSAALIT